MGVFDKFQSLFKRETKLEVDKRFEILREAISGTMSNFYMARDRQNDEIVGLKVGDREKVATFEARFKGLKKPPEGQIAISLHHPHIVVTKEYGVTSDGLPYVVMEFLDGPGLHVVLHKRDPLLEGKRLKLIRQMAEALSEVHRAGYIHRDVCPRNFICTPDLESLKLIDFGLTLPAQREFMQPGNRTGTPLYMAPEVVRRRWTDQRVDIFSFGVTAYQVCTYELPWPVSETTGRAALAHDTEPPREILDFRPALNRVLARAIMRCLAPDAKDRTPSMEVFLKQIAPAKADDELAPDAKAASD